MQRSYTRRAELAEAREPEFRSTTGQLRLPFRVDSLDHVVHAVFHDLPHLPPDVWAACVEELALACMVDVSTASMAKEARFGFFEPGSRGRAVFRAATEALRLEALSDWHLPLGLLPVKLGGAGRARSVRPQARADPNRVLLLMGGGKDSLYAYRLLRQAGYDVRCLYVTEARRTWQQLRRVYEALKRECVQYRVYLDANRRTALERKYGDVYLSQFQIGQVVAAALPYALAHGCRYLALGLERSSDAHMVRYRGRAVNHQHQKSSGFIRLLNRHLAWRFQGAVEIVSPLHGLYDMGIYARFLTTTPALTKLQASCGGANGRSPNCGRCEKCAFIAALLAGLGDDKRLYRRIFPRDPLEDPDLYAAWLAPGAHRPLTCAGFREEVEMSLALIRRNGWRSKVLAAYPDVAIDRDQLVRFLAVHPNRMMPDAMRRRLAPHLKLDMSEWLRG